VTYRGHRAGWEALGVYGMIGGVAASEFGAGSAGAAYRWTDWLVSMRGLLIVAAALLVTNVPFKGIGNSGQPDYFWSTLAVLLALQQIWRRQRLAWFLSIAVTAANLVFYGLSMAGVTNAGLPGWWIPIAGVADIAALAILLSAPVRRWVR
jgi:hypothetical protein